MNSKVCAMQNFLKKELAKLFEKRTSALFDSTFFKDLL